MTERLVFRLDDIPPEGLEYDLAPDPALYGISEVRVVHPPGISGWLRIVKEKGDLVVTGEVRATIEASCNRCLGKLVSPVGGEFSFRMVPEARTPKAEEYELEAGDLDVEFFTGDEVDARSIIAEQIYLNVPMRMICRDDCKGLCPRCGQDLNQKDCGHRTMGERAGWEALQKLNDQKRKRN